MMAERTGVERRRSHRANRTLIFAEVPVSLGGRRQRDLISPERGREDEGANQHPGIPQTAIPNPVQDPIPVLRRSSRIHHLASTQRPMGILHSR